MEEQRREVLRKDHNVRLMTSEEDGFAVRNLSPGVFGFTYAPGTESPLFHKRSYQSFEVHKGHDQALHLIGFVTQKDADLINSKEEIFEVRLFPEPWQEATEIVSIPMRRVLNGAFKPDRQDGNALPLRISSDHLGPIRARVPDEISTER
jgi:hypothetical protein